MSGPSSRPAVHWSRKAHVPAEQSDVESDSSDEVTEDEEGTDLTPALDAAILRTLGKIRRGEGVYEGENVLATELEQAKAEALRRGVKARQGRVETKPYLLQDHHRTALLEGRVDEEAEEEENRWRPVPYAQEQRRLRKEAIDAFAVDADDDESEGFEPVKKEEKDGDKEDEEYRAFLLEMGGGEEEVRRLLGMGDSAVSFVRADAEEVEGGDSGEVAEPGQKKKGKDSEKKIKKKMEKKAKADDEFLMNFILNRGWVDKADGGDHNYAEMALDPPRIPPIKQDDEEADEEEEEGKAGPSHPWGLLDEDEFDEKADEFETEYNFRFEEPGAAEISSHPRKIDSLVRRPDDARILKRQARAERKAARAAAAEEEARKAKGSKRREMDSQLAKLRKEVGEKEWAKVEEILEGEYDEGTWERVVGGLFAAGDDDDEKPTWDDDDEGIYPEDEEEGEGVQEHAEEGEDFDGPINMDADFIGFEEPEKKSKTDKKGKGKKGAVQEEEEEDEGLTVEQRAEKLKKAMEEYKALDHEDMIGDLPTRFHYTSSAPLTYGLSPAEILLATDAELNQIMSVKHLAPYRHAGLGSAVKGMGKRVKDLKDSLKDRRWGEEYVAPKEEGQGGGRERDRGWPKASGAAGEVVKKKRMGKNERKRKLGEGVSAGEGGAAPPAPVPASGGGQNGVPKNAQPAADASGPTGETPKKRRKKNKSGKGGGAETA